MQLPTVQLVPEQVVIEMPGPWGHIAHVPPQTCRPDEHDVATHAPPLQPVLAALLGHIAQAPLHKR